VPVCLALLISARTVELSASSCTSVSGTTVTAMVPAGVLGLAAGEGLAGVAMLAAGDGLLLGLVVLAVGEGDELGLGLRLGLGLGLGLGLAAEALEAADVAMESVPAAGLPLLVSSCGGGVGWWGGWVGGETGQLAFCLARGRRGVMGVGGEGEGTPQGRAVAAALPGRQAHHGAPEPSSCRTPPPAGPPSRPPS
jgi:hypothetical protein